MSEEERVGCSVGWEAACCRADHPHVNPTCGLQRRTEGEQPQGVVDPILVLVRQDLGSEPDGKVLDGDALHLEVRGCKGGKKGERGK
jgi:hypothetical protein